MSCVSRRVAELFRLSPRAVGELEAGKWGGQPAARGDLGFGGGAQMGGGGSARGEVPPGAFGCHRCRWVRWVGPELGEPREICASVLSSLSN